MMEKVEKYAHLYDLPRRLEDAMVHFYTFQYRKKIGASETVGVIYRGAWRFLSIM